MIRCRTNALYADKFPQSLKRVGVDALTGTIVSPNLFHDCVTVKWDQHKGLMRLHQKFVKIERAIEGQSE